MNRRVLLLRAGHLLLIAVLMASLLASSSLLRLLPMELPPGWGVWAFGVAMLALVPALLAGGSPLPATLGVLVPVLAVATYGSSRLDWLKTLKDFGVTDDASPSALRLLLGGAALFLAWSLHVSDTATRLRQHSEERGISEGQARMAHNLILQRGARAGARALGIALVMGVVVLAASQLGEGIVPVGNAAFLVPILATALLAAGALLVAGLRKDSTDEAEQVRL